MKKYAIIQNGLVVNSIEYKTPPENPLPGFDDTYIAIQSDAGPGYTYANGIFTPPQPYPSWVLVDNVWTAPVAYPTDGKPYIWNEATKSWVSF